MAGKNSKITIDDPLLVFPYSPTYKPSPVPTVSAACEAPYVDVRFACALIPYVLGALEVWCWEDAFIGTLEERTLARRIFRDLQGVFAMASKNCGCEDEKTFIYRISPENGQIERSSDGGETWETSPDDPYSLGTQLPPLAGAPGSVKMCQAANNVIQQLKGIQQRWSGWLGTITDILEFEEKLVLEVLALLFVPGEGGVIADIITRLIGKVIETANDMIVVTPEEYDGWFTADVWEQALCILRCNINSDGTFDAGGWQRSRDQMEEQITGGDGTPGNSIKCMIDSLGVVGLNNATTIKSPIFIACTDCDCGCGDGCEFQWSGVSYACKPADDLWLFNAPDCDISATYRCIPNGQEGLLSGLPGDCASGFRYSVARAGGSPSTGITILINGTDTIVDPMAGMATDGTPQPNRVINFETPRVVNSIRLTCSGVAGNVYIRELEFSICPP